MIHTMRSLLFEIMDVAPFGLRILPGIVPSACSAITPASLGTERNIREVHVSPPFSTWRLTIASLNQVVYINNVLHGNGLACFDPEICQEYSAQGIQKHPIPLRTKCLREPDGTSATE